MCIATKNNIKYANFCTVFQYLPSFLIEKIFDVQVNIKDTIKANIHHQRYPLGSQIIELSKKLGLKLCNKKYQTTCAIAKEPEIIPSSFLRVTAFAKILYSGNISLIGLKNIRNTKNLHASSQNCE